MSESRRFRLLISLVPGKSNPAEYRAEGSNCQVQGVFASETSSTEIHDSARLSRGPGVLAIPTEDDDEPLTIKKRSGRSNSLIYGEECLGWMPGGSEARSSNTSHGLEVSSAALAPWMRSITGVRPDPGFGHPESPSCDQPRRRERGIQLGMTFGETTPAGFDQSGATGVTFCKKAEPLEHRAIDET